MVRGWRVGRLPVDSLQSMLVFGRPSWPDTSVSVGLRIAGHHGRTSALSITERQNPAMRTHMWAIVLRCGLLLPLLFSFQLTSAAAAEAPPDLAALVIRPSDLIATGYEEFSIHRSILADRARQAAEFADDFNAWFGTELPTGTAIRRANPDLTYIQHLADRANRVIVTLMAFPTGRDAERGMEAYVGSLEDWISDEAATLEMDGVDSAVRLERDATYKGNPFETIVFQLDTFVGVVQVHHGFEGRGVEAEAVAVLQRDRLADGQPTTISHLVSQLVRLRGHGWDQYDTSYLGVEGEAIPRFEEIDNAGIFDSRQYNMTHRGALDIYLSQQIVYGTWPSWTYDYETYAYFHSHDPEFIFPTGWLAITIASFDPEVGAYLAEEIRSQYGLDSGLNEEVQVPLAGYETVGINFDDGNSPWASYRVWIWLDENTVLHIRHETAFVSQAQAAGVDLTPDIAATNELILHQIACFEGTHSCDTTVRSPYSYGEG